MVDYVCNPIFIPISYFFVTAKEKSQYQFTDRHNLASQKT